MQALLHEIAERLERLAATGEADLIDLRSLPLAWRYLARGVLRHARDDKAWCRSSASTLS